MTGLASARCIRARLAGSCSKRAEGQEQLSTAGCGSGEPKPRISHQPWPGRRERGSDASQARQEGAAASVLLDIGETLS